MYFGQQKITAVAPSDGAGIPTNPINTQPQINAITYTVNADPTEATGTWSANRTGSNSACNQFGQHKDSVLGTTTNGYNYPINVYPAGSYGYTVSAASSEEVQSKADPQVTVNYPAGLGTSVAANFKNDSNAASLSTTVSLQQDSGAQTLQ